MRQPAARKGDQIVSKPSHTHTVIVPGPSSTRFPHPCVWEISENLSPDVNIEGQPAATVGSGGNNAGARAHKPLPLGIASAFATPPPTMDQATITAGSSTVNINDKSAAFSGGACFTCDESGGDASGKVVSSCSVWIGD